MLANYLVCPNCFCITQNIFTSMLMHETASVITKGCKTNCAFCNRLLAVPDMVCRGTGELILKKQGVPSIWLDLDLLVRQVEQSLKLSEEHPEAQSQEKWHPPSEGAKSNQFRAVLYLTLAMLARDSPKLAQSLIESVRDVSIAKCKTLNSIASTEEIKSKIESLSNQLADVLNYIEASRIEEMINDQTGKSILDKVEAHNRMMSEIWSQIGIRARQLDERAGQAKGTGSNDWFCDQ